MRQTFSYALLITWIFVAVSCKTNYVRQSYTIENVSVSAEANGVDSSVVQLYMPYKQILEDDMGKVISVTETELTKGKPESPLTNFLADLFLEESSEKAELLDLQLTPSVSFFNYGGIRRPLPEGKITVGNIFELMPFENEMVYIELQGKQLQEFFDYVADHGGGSIGGARLKISDKKAVDIYVGDSKLDPEKYYWLVTNDYVASGGDGLGVLGNGRKFHNSHLKIRDIIIAHLEAMHKQNEIISVKLDGRISYE